MSRPPLLYLWKHARSRPTRSPVASVFSVVAHAVLIGAAVAGTQQAVDTFDAQPVQPFMLRLMNRVPRQGVEREATRFVDLSWEVVPPGVVTTFDPVTPPHDPEPLDVSQTPQPGVHIPAQPTSDSVFTIYDVDAAVEALLGTAGPEYPPELVQAHVEGAVLVEYVVDTTGRADSLTIQVLRSTDDRFSRSVRSAVLGMRFKPARIGPLLVRQLVRQPFTFRLVTDSTTMLSQAKTP